MSMDESLTMAWMEIVADRIVDFVIVVQRIAKMDHHHHHHHHYYYYQQYLGSFHQ